jgi:hypothetical protein
MRLCRANGTSRTSRRGLRGKLKTSRLFQPHKREPPLQRLSVSGAQDIASPNNLMPRSNSAACCFRWVRKPGHGCTFQQAASLYVLQELVLFHSGGGMSRKYFAKLFGAASALNRLHHTSGRPNDSRLLCSDTGRISRGRGKRCSPPSIHELIRAAKGDNRPQISIPLVQCCALRGQLSFNIAPNKIYLAIEAAIEIRECTCLSPANKSARYTITEVLCSDCFAVIFSVQFCLKLLQGG